MIKRGTSEVIVSIDHDAVDFLQEVIVKVDWIYAPEIPRSLVNDFGEPYDFIYDAEILSAPDWVTLEMVERALDEMSIFDIMNS